MRRQWNVTVSVGIGCTVLIADFVAAQQDSPARPPGRTVEVRKIDRDPVLHEALAKRKERMEVFERLRVLAGPQGERVEERIVIMNGNANVVTSYEARLRPILKAEYQLLVTVCGPTKAQRREIARAGERSLKDAAVAVRGLQRTVENRRVPGDASPRQIIQKTLAAKVIELLSPEVASRYAREVLERNDFEKAAIVRSLVASLSLDLCLTTAQRDTIYDSLFTNFDEIWCPSLQALTSASANLRSIPSQYIVPILSKEQLDVWTIANGLQQASVNRMFVGMIIDTVPLADAELNGSSDADQEGKQ